MIGVLVTKDVINAGNPAQIKMKNELIEKQIGTVADQALSFKIKDTATMTTGVAFLSELNKALDKITADREKITAPMNVALREVRAKYKPAEDILTQAIAHVRTEMSFFRTKQLAEEKNIADKVSAGKMSITKAVAKLADIKSEVVTESGSVSFRTSYELEVTNAKDIPDGYYVLDERKLLDELKQGKQIRGARLREVHVPINRRN